MIEYKILQNGFQYIEITNIHASAKIALQGAHVFAYQAHNKPKVLWLSSKSMMEEGKAIRGGIPICFPWFGKNNENMNLPQHGFARTSIWNVVQEEEKEDGSTLIRLQLTQTTQTRKLWAYDFEVNLDVVVAENLSLRLNITNMDKKDFKISTALHAYFDISDIKNISIEGLLGQSYYDALTQKMYMQDNDLSIQAEIDRVYQMSDNSITLHDIDKKITIISRNSNSLVVWNPSVKKSNKMIDMADDGYKTMICLETANAREDSRIVGVGETHSLAVTYKYTEIDY